MTILFLHDTTIIVTRRTLFLGRLVTRERECAKGQTIETQIKPFISDTTEMVIGDGVALVKNNLFAILM